MSHLNQITHYVSASDAVLSSAHKCPPHAIDATSFLRRRRLDGVEWTLRTLSLEPRRVGLARALPEFSGSGLRERRARVSLRDAVLRPVDAVNGEHGDVVLVPVPQLFFVLVRDVDGYQRMGRVVS